MQVLSSWQGVKTPQLNYGKVSGGVFSACLTRSHLTVLEDLLDQINELSPQYPAHPSRPISL